MLYLVPIILIGVSVGYASRRDVQARHGDHLLRVCLAVMCIGFALVGSAWLVAGSGSLALYALGTITTAVGLATSAAILADKLIRRIH